MQHLSKQLNLSSDSELLSLGVKHKIIKKTGSFYYINCLALHGKEAVRKFLTENGSIREEIALILREKLLRPKDEVGEYDDTENAEPLEETISPETTDDDKC